MAVKQTGFLLSAISAILLTPHQANAALVVDDLLTSASLGDGWLVCETDNAILDLTQLGNGGCAYQEFKVQPNTTYKLTCAINSTKYAAVTLGFSDANYLPLGSESTEVLGDEQGSYSVTLTTSATASFGAVGVYGEHGTGIQDCVVVDTTPVVLPTVGSISGTTWFDADGDGVMEDSETIIPATLVELMVDGDVFAQTESDISGNYYFGQLPLDKTYSVRFKPAAASLGFTVTGGDSAAAPDTGLSGDITLSTSLPNSTGVSAGFMSIGESGGPADYAICGVTWVDVDKDGIQGAGDQSIDHVEVRLHDIDNGTWVSMTSASSGNFVFSGLSSGNYALEYVAPNGHIFTSSNGTPVENGSYPYADNGWTDTFNLPAAINTGPLAPCSLKHANAGFIEEETAIAPTVAHDDQVEALVGESLSIDIVSNDEPCDDTVLEVDVLSHNVPGSVSVSNDGTTLLVTDTTAEGTYSVQYGLRGACGSYDDATVNVTLKLPEAVSTALNYCRFRKFRQVVELWRTNRHATQAVLDSFVPPRSVITDAGLDLTAGMGWAFGKGPNTAANVSSIVADPVQYGDHNYYYVFAATWNKNMQVQYPTHTVVGRRTTITVTNNDGSTYTKNCSTIGSPIALDINADNRVERIRGVFTFDIDADGEVDTLNEWFGPSEGILVEAELSSVAVNDEDTGVADSISSIFTGAHLFGDLGGQFSDGFAKLAMRDSNKDGEISGAELSGLAIWTDKNSNAKRDSGEMSSLLSHGVVSLSTSHSQYQSSAQLANGQTMLTEDLWFQKAGITLAGVPFNPASMAPLKK